MPSPLKAKFEAMAVEFNAVFGENIATVRQNSKQLPNSKNISKI